MQIRTQLQRDTLVEGRCARNELGSMKAVASNSAYRTAVEIEFPVLLPKFANVGTFLPIPSSCKARKATHRPYIHNQQMRSARSSTKRITYKLGTRRYNIPKQKGKRKLVYR